MIQLSTMPDDVLLICGYCLVGDDNDGSDDLRATTGWELGQVIGALVGGEEGQGQDDQQESLLAASTRGHLSLSGLWNRERINLWTTILDRLPICWQHESKKSAKKHAKLHSCKSSIKSTSVRMMALNPGNFRPICILMIHSLPRMFTLDNLSISSSVYQVLLLLMLKLFLTVHHF